MILITGIITFALTAAGTLSATAAAGMVFRAFVLFCRMAGAAPSAGGTAAFAAGFTPYRNARNERHEQYRYYYNNYLYRLHILSYPSPSTIRARRRGQPGNADFHRLFSCAAICFDRGGFAPHQEACCCYACPRTRTESFERALFDIFPQFVARRSAATTSLPIAKIYPKIPALKCFRRMRVQAFFLVRPDKGLRPTSPRHFRVQCLSFHLPQPYGLH